MTTKTSRIQSSINRADVCSEGGNKKAGLVPSNEWNGITSQHVKIKGVSKMPNFIRRCCADYPHVTTR
jgi:hypothetical protein